MHKMLENDSKFVNYVHYFFFMKFMQIREKIYTTKLYKIIIYCLNLLGYLAVNGVLSVVDLAFALSSYSAKNPNITMNIN